MNNKPYLELDDIKIDDWFVAFAVIMPEIDSSMKNFQKLAPVLEPIYDNVYPMLTLGEGETKVSMNIIKTTQRQALLIAYAGLTTLFERVAAVPTIRAARMSRHSNLDDAYALGYRPKFLDVSSYAIDLDMVVSSIVDLEIPSDL